MSEQVTHLLAKWRDGDPNALDSLTPIVYDELRRLAAKFISRESPSHTLQPTALLHEAYLRLAQQREQDWQSRAHFFGIAAHLMRLILVDHARSKKRLKRGSGEIVLSYDDSLKSKEARSASLTELDEALTELATIDPRKAKIIEMRYFGGMSMEETATALEISTSTLGREQRLAQAWLKRYLSGDNQPTE